MGVKQFKVRPTILHLSKCYIYQTYLSNYSHCFTQDAFSHVEKYNELHFAALNLGLELSGFAKCANGMHIVIHLQVHDYTERCKIAP